MAKTERHTPPLRLTMFHFLCPLCGAKPGERPLRAYLEEWAASPVARVAGLADSLRSIIAAFTSGPPRWVERRFVSALDDLVARAGGLHEKVAAMNRGESVASSSPPDRCVVCYTPIGERESDRYFTSWDKACGVQTANLLYEVGLILWRLVREIPAWCDAATLAELDGLRRSLRSASDAMGILRCPICRRPTTHLYGTTRSFCRWCMDMSGGFGVGARITLDGTVQLIQPDATKAVVEDADLLPPADSYRVADKPPGRPSGKD